MAGSAHVSAALAAFAVLSTLFILGDAQCYTAAPDCSGASVGLGTAEGCCVGVGVSYNNGTGCQRCYVIGYTEGSRVQTIAEGVTSTLFVEVVKPAIGVDTAANAQTLNFEINNSENIDDVHIGGQSRPTGFVLSGPFVRIRVFQIRAEADQIGQEGDEVFQISLSASPGDVPVFVSTPNAIITVEDTSEVIVELTEADYQMKEGFGDVLTARVSYSRELANPITLRFFPVTYDRYERVLGLILPSDFPSIDIRASEADFNSASITVTLPRPGGGFPRQVEVEVPFVDDAINEFQETYIGYIVIDDAVDRDTIMFQTTATQLIINDNDDIAIGFAEASYTFLEGASNPSVVLRKDSGRISERTDIAVMVDLSGTFSATRGPDFEVVLLSTRIDFAPNEQEETISLTIVDDNLPEGLESFRLTVTSVELGFGPRFDTFDTTEVFITDNDVLQFKVDDVVVNEGEGTALVVVELLSDIERDVVLEYNTGEVAGGATEDADFNQRSGSIRFLPGQSKSQSFTIPITDDQETESDEPLRVTFTSPGLQPGMVNIPTPTITIIDNDMVVGFNPTTYSVTEGVDMFARLMIVRTGRTDLAGNVTLSTVPGSAEGGVDYLAISVTVMFQPGDESVTLDVPILDDTILEEVELFSALLTSDAPNVIVEDDRASAGVSIFDNDRVTIGFVATMYPVNEDDGSAVVSVAVLGELSGDVAVTMSTQRGSAIDPDDYGLTSQTLVFGPGNTRANITIPLKDDNVHESVVIWIVASIGSSCTSSSGVTSVRVARNSSDDDAPDPQFVDPVYTVPEDNRTIPLCVDIGVGITQPITYTITTAHKNPAEAEDLDFSGGTTITIQPPGPVECIDFTGLVIDDLIALEGDEAFAIFIDGTSSMSMVTIRDDDNVMVGFNPTSYMVREGSSTELTIMRIGDAEADVEVVVTTSGRTATGGVDYNELTRVSVIFMPGVNTQTVTLTTLPDVPVEEDEDLGATLTATDGRVGVFAAEATVTITDEVPMPQIEETMYTVPENDRTIPLCIDIGVGITQPMEYVIRAVQKSPPEAEDTDFSSSASITVDVPGPRACTDFMVLVVDDNVALEGNEAFTILIGPSVTETSSMAMVNIVDDDVPMMNIPDVSVIENAGPAHVVPCAKVDNPVEMAFNLLCTTVEIAGGATDGVDYFGGSATLQFSPSDDEDCAPINIIDDTQPESNEKFNVACSLVNIPAPSTTFMVTIMDNDAPVVVFGFSEAIKTVGESEGNLHVTVTQSRVTAQSFTLIASPVTYSENLPLPPDFPFAPPYDPANPNNATPGVDFSGDNITFTISPGDSGFVVKFRVFDDQIQENSEENFIGLLHFSGNSTGAVIGRNAIRLVIEDNDYQGADKSSTSLLSILLPIAITLIVLVAILGIAAVIVFWKRKRLGKNSSRNSYDLPEPIYDVPDDKGFSRNTSTQHNDEKIDVTSELNTILQSSPSPTEMKSNIAYGCVPVTDAIPPDYTLPTPSTFKQSSVDALPPFEMQSNAAYAVNRL